jgi:beta-hydroxyacyl-ACP dehydratase FabZ
MEYLPHRYPMLLVDRILSLEPMVRCVGLKNVTMNEAFFQGHYPGLPIMPGVLIVEAMAQAGACMVLGDEKNKGFVPMIGAVDNVRFRKPVVPGDQLISKTELKWFRSNMGCIEAVGEVDGEAVAEMKLTFKLVRMLADGD